MRKILFFVCLLFSVVGFSQNPTNYQYRVVYERLRGMMPDSAFHLPRYNGVPSGLRGGMSPNDGALASDTLNGHVYHRWNLAWHRLALYADIAANIPNLQQVTDVGNTTTNTIITPELQEASALFQLSVVAGQGRLTLANGTAPDHIRPQAASLGSSNRLPFTGNVADTLATLYDIRQAGGGGGSGTVNTGAALKAAYYPSAAALVDDFIGMELGNTNLTAKILPQATTDVGLEIKLQSAATANGLNISSSSGTGDLANFQANGSASIDGNTFKVDGVNNRVGIVENGTPQTMLQIGEDGGASSSFGTAAQMFFTNNGSNTYITGRGPSGSEVFFGAETGQGTFGVYSNHPLLLRTNNATRMTISNAGAVRFHPYGVGTFTGTPARYLAVEADGDVIETTASSLKPALNKALTIEAPSASEAIDMWQTPVAITVTSLKAILRGTTPSVTYNVRFGTDITSATTVFTSDITCTSVTTGCSNNSGFNDATIPAGSFIWIITSASSGTITSISLTLNYTED